MRKFLLPLVVLLLGCQLLPTPDDFPPPPPTDPGTPPPMTVIVEWPQFTPTTTLEPNLRPILPDDMQDAETFFLIFKTSLAAGDDVGVAEWVKYPIWVRVGGQELRLNDRTEFLEQYEAIFDQEFVTAIFATDETNLTLLPNGVQVGNGELWFNSFCVDLTCSEAQFLITQINK